MIAIIDYGVGNLRSVEKAFENQGHNAIVTANPSRILEADRVVLPGVGAFGRSMENLAKAGMIPVVKEVIASGRPFLGICLGLQMLFEESAEMFGESCRATAGLGVVRGTVLKLGVSNLKVPQIGWNRIYKQKETPLLHNVADGSFVYFVHSYYVKPADESVAACRTEYGFSYCSGISHGNIHAVQFHPEKSSQIGLTILNNFARLK